MRLRLERRWTWKHTVCVRILLLLRWPTWKAYDKTKRWLG